MNWNFNKKNSMWCLHLLLFSVVRHPTSTKAFTEIDVPDQECVCCAYVCNSEFELNCVQRLDVSIEADEWLFGNPDVQKFTMQGSGIRKIPTSVCGLHQLLYLGMKNNSLEILDRECFRDLSKLLLVLMAENRLTEIPDNIFDNCSSLQVVDFSHNKIRSIGMHVFSNVSNLKNLKLINLSGNMLTTLEPWPLIRMINNRALIDLSKNRINIFTNELNWIHKCNMGASAGALDLRHNTYSRLSGIQDGWGIDFNDMLCILKNSTIVHERKAYICDCKEYWWLRLYGSMFIESCITIDQTKCHASSFLGWLIQPTSTSLALDTLNCTHSCFDDQCTCTEIPDRMEYHVKCYNHSQVPTELPKPYHWNPSYQFTLDFPNQHMTVFVMNIFSIIFEVLISNLSNSTDQSGFETAEKEIVLKYLNTSDDDFTKNKLFGQEFNSKLECFAYSICTIFLRVICNKRLDITEEVDTLLPQNSDNIITTIHSAGLKRIPASVCGLRQLQRLDMKNNSLEILDRECFRDLSKLLLVLMPENRLTEIPDNIFDSCSSLQMVDFSHNKIRSIGMHVFSNVSNLKNLKYINLSGNMLTTLEPWPLIRMQISETHIDLENNLIHLFTNELNWIHKRSTQVINGSLDLRFNAYTRLSDIQRGWEIDFVDMACTLPKIIIETNKPYVCDCMEYWWFLFYGMLDTVSCITDDQPQCQSPSLPDWIVKPPNTSLPSNVLICVQSCYEDQCTCTEIPYNGTYHVKCVNQSDLPYELPKPYWNSFNYRFILDFSNNQMTHLISREYLVNVTILDVSNNQIHFVDSDALRKLIRASEIKLNSNRLQLFHSYDHIFSLNFKGKISLHSNPWACTCRNSALKGTILSLNSSLTNHDVLCSTPEWLEGSNLLGSDFCEEEISIVVHHATFKRTAALLGVFFVSLICILALLLCYRNRIRDYMRNRRWQKEMKWDDMFDGEYDAFVSFAWDDREAVRTVSESLEGEHGFSCCLHDRDFHPAQPFLDQMGRSMDASRRVLCFLSPDFVKSKYCVWEFKHSFEEDDLRGMRRLVAILLEPVNDTDFDKTNEVVRKYISKFTYLDINDPDFMVKLLRIMARGKG